MIKDLEELIKNESFDSLQSLYNHKNYGLTNLVWKKNYEGKEIFVKVFNPYVDDIENRFKNEVSAYLSKELPTPNLISYGDEAPSFIIFEKSFGKPLRNFLSTYEPKNISSSIADLILNVHESIPPFTSTLESHYHYLSKITDNKITSQEFKKKYQ